MTHHPQPKVSEHQGGNIEITMNHRGITPTNNTKQTMLNKRKEEKRKEGKKMKKKEKMKKMKKKKTCQTGDQTYRTFSHYTIHPLTTTLPSAYLHHSTLGSLLPTA